MDHYAGIDVSLEYSTVCVVDGCAQESRRPAKRHIELAPQSNTGLPVRVTISGHFRPHGKGHAECFTSDSDTVVRSSLDP
jgi:hypothetical protein